MSSAFHLTLVLMSSFSLALGLYQFKAEHCEGVEGADKDLKLVEMHVTPDPIVIPGTIEGGVKFEVKKAPVQGKSYSLVVSMKKSGWEDVFPELPCVSGFGSCTYDFCGLLANQSKTLESEGKCGDLPCSCDQLKPGVFDFPSLNIDVTKEMMSQFSFFSSLIYGDYKANLKIVREGSDEVLACIHLEFSLAPSDSV